MNLNNYWILAVCVLVHTAAAEKQSEGNEHMKGNDQTNGDIILDLIKRIERVEAHNTQLLADNTALNDQIKNQRKMLETFQATLDEQIERKMQEIFEASFNDQIQRKMQKTFEATLNDQIQKKIQEMIKATLNDQIQKKMQEIFEATIHDQIQNQTNMQDTFEHKFQVQTNLMKEISELKDDLTKIKGKQNNFVSFTAFATTSRYYDNGDILQFDETVVNIGNNYDPTTGIFVCPVTAYYMFAVNPVNTAGGMISGVFYVNNTFTTVHAFGESSGYTQGSAMIVSPCNAGEEVWVRAFNTMEMGGGVSHFTGTLLQIM